MTSFDVLEFNSGIVSCDNSRPTQLVTEWLWMVIDYWNYLDEEYILNVLADNNLVLLDSYYPSPCGIDD